MTHQARLAALCLAGGLSLFAPGADAADERLCSIKRIEQTTSGVNLHFVAARQVMVMHDQEGDLYLIDAGAREAAGSAKAPRTLHWLPLKAGEQAVLRNTADEQCSITLAYRNGKVGVEVELSGPAWDGKRNSPKSTNPRFGKFLPAE